MPDPIKMNHPCDLCGADQPILVPCSPSYMDGQSINVCSESGFVYVNERRSSKAIADSWSDDLYQSDYTARIPSVKAWQTYVADTIETEKVCATSDYVTLVVGRGNSFKLPKVMNIMLMYSQSNHRQTTAGCWIV